MKLLSKLFLSFVLLLCMMLLVAFYLQNAQLVKIDLLFNQNIELPLGLALVLSLIGGLVIGLLAALPAITTLKARLALSKKRLQDR